jgi:hypothetical protein
MDKTDREALDIFQEECAELQEECIEIIKKCAEGIGRASKAIRFGLDDVHPKTGITNRKQLELEAGHLWAMINVLIDRGIITEDGVFNGSMDKKKKLKEWSTLYDG